MSTMTGDRVESKSATSVTVCSLISSTGFGSRSSSFRSASFLCLFGNTNKHESLLSRSMQLPLTLGVMSYFTHYAYIYGSYQEWLQNILKLKHIWNRVGTACGLRISHGARVAPGWRREAQPGWPLVALLGKERIAQNWMRTGFPTFMLYSAMPL